MLNLPWVSGRYARGGQFAAGPAAPVDAAGVTREDDLIGWWKLDESSGTSAADSTDTGNNGTASNMVDGDWVSGKNGNCLDFDGTNDRVNMAADSSYPTENFSMSCWFNLSATGAYRSILCSTHYAAAGHDGNWIFRLNGTNGGSPTMALRCVNGVTSFCDKTESITISTDEWHHGGFVHNATSNTAHLFYDGSELGSGTATGGNDLENIKDMGFAIGVQSWSTTPLNANFWAGQIDDVRLYNAVLAASDFSDIYNSGDGDWP